MIIHNMKTNNMMPVSPLVYLDVSEVLASSFVEPVSCLSGLRKGLKEFWF